MKKHKRPYIPPYRGNDSRPMYRDLSQPGKLQGMDMHYIPYQSATDCKYIVIADRAYKAIISETLTNGRNETGGILLGNFDNGIWYIVESVDPGLKTVRDPVNFEYDPVYVNHLVDKLSLLYENPLTILGVWHRHPGGMNTFSGQDMISMAHMVNDARVGLISMLVTVNPDLEMTFYYCNKAGEVMPVPYSVGDEFFRPDVLFYASDEDLCQRITQGAVQIKPVPDLIPAEKFPGSIASLNQATASQPVEEPAAVEDPVAQNTPDLIPDISVEDPLLEDITIGETPVDEAPVEDIPVNETPAEETPVEEPPVDETPVEEPPAEEAPAEEPPAEEPLVDETPAEEAPVEDAPVNEAPAEESPASDGCAGTEPRSWEKTINTKERMCYHTVLSDRAFRALTNEAALWAWKETGGVLLGYIHDAVWYILESIPAGPQSIRADGFFHPDDSYIAYQIDALQALYPFPLVPLGEWRHPSVPTDSLSPDDLIRLSSLDHSTPLGKLSMVVRTDGTLEMSMYHGAQDRTYCRVPVSVGNHYIPQELQDIHTPYTIRLADGTTVTVQKGLIPDPAKFPRRIRFSAEP